MRKKGDICPAGIGRDNHPIGPLVINEKIRTDMEDYIGSQNLDEKRFEKRKERIKNLELRIHVAVRDLVSKCVMADVMLADFSKIGVRVGAKGWEIYVINQLVMERAAQEVIKKTQGLFSEVGKQVLEQSEKKVMKCIPVFCIAIGAYSACRRFFKGQYWRGTGEVVSILANSAGFVFPPAIVGGPIVASVTDALMLGADIAEYRSAPSTQTIEENPLAVAIQFDLANSYFILGFSSNPAHPPTQAEVDLAFTSLNQEIQLQDLVGIEVSENWLQKSNRCMAVLQSAREIIYQNRGWVIGP